MKHETADPSPAPCSMLHAPWPMPCPACQEKVNYVDYKQTDVLRKFVSGQFKISSSSRSELCKKHQRMVANAVKLARFMALMPYTRGQTRKK